MKYDTATVVEFSTFFGKQRYCSNDETNINATQSRKITFLMDRGGLGTSWMRDGEASVGESTRQRGRADGSSWTSFCGMSGLAGRRLSAKVGGEAEKL